MGTFKAVRFPVQARWLGGRLLRLGAREKPALRVATPPEFKNGIPGIWSPEDLLVGSLAACYELTLVALAERHGVPLHTLRVDATGHLERGPDGGYGFASLELDVELTTAPDESWTPRRSLSSRRGTASWGGRWTSRFACAEWRPAPPASRSSRRHEGSRKTGHAVNFGR